MGGACGWGFGLAASCAAKKEKLRSWTVVGPGTERGGFRESPYKTVGKSGYLGCPHGHHSRASMKALPKRKGNGDDLICGVCG